MRHSSLVINSQYCSLADPVQVSCRLGGSDIWQQTFPDFAKCWQGFFLPWRCSVAIPALNLLSTCTKVNRIHGMSSLIIQLKNNSNVELCKKELDAIYMATGTRGTRAPNFSAQYKGKHYNCPHFGSPSPPKFSLPESV